MLTKTGFITLDVSRAPLKNLFSLFFVLSLSIFIVFNF